MQRKAFLAILLIIVLGGACFANDGSWPKVKEFDDDFLAYSGTKSIDFIRPIFDVNGTIKYLFVCRGGTTEYTDPLSDRLGINYVSPLTCILNDGDKETESSLLADDDSSPWHTRGQYHLNELIGDCGDYPEYGRLRHFKLRGFELTLTAQDVVLNKNGQVVSFKIKMSMRQNEANKTAYAEQPGYLNPRSEGRSCKTVLKANDIRMCRDWVHKDNFGSWIDCDKLKTAK